MSHGGATKDVGLQLQKAEQQPKAALTRKGKKARPSILGPNEERAVMTVQDVADYLHCHSVTIYRLVKRGGLPGFKLGSDWRFHRSEIDKWIAKGGRRQAISRAGEATNEHSKPKRASAKSPDSTDEIMGVSSLAHYLRCHPSTIYTLVRHRELPAFKIGSDWRFIRSQVDQWVAETRYHPQLGRLPRE